MVNKALKEIMGSLKDVNMDINEAAAGGSINVSKMLQTLKLIPDTIEKNMDKIPEEHRGIIEDLLKEAKEKTSQEYIYKQAFKK